MRLENKIMTDVFKWVDEQRRAFQEVEAEDRNFQIILENSRPFKLVKDNGEMIDLSDLLPPTYPRYSFVPKDRYSCLHDLKHIHYPTEGLKYRGAILSILHEIGHANYPKQYDIPGHRRLVATSQIFFSWLGDTVKFGISALTQRSTAPLEALVKLPFEWFAPPWYLEELNKVDAKSERDAWAYALRQARTFQRQGFNVFAGFNNVAEVKTFVFNNLVTFDMNRAFTVLLAGGVEALNSYPLRIFATHTGRKFVSLTGQD